MLHVRLRNGSAHTQRGILRFCDELVARVARSGATGARLLRADLGFSDTGDAQIAETTLEGRRPIPSEWLGGRPRCEAVVRP